MSTPANALDITQAGLVKFDGVSNFTGVTTTQYNTLVGATSNGISNITPGTTGQVLTSAGAASNPSYQTISNSILPGSGQVTLSSGNNILVTGGSPLSLGGAATIAVTGTTNHAIQLGNASGSLTSSTALTNGQLLIGSTGSDPVSGTLTAGSGISITNSSGSITIAAQTPSQVATSQVDLVDDFIGPLSGGTSGPLNSQLNWGASFVFTAASLDSGHPGIISIQQTGFVSSPGINLSDSLNGSQPIILGGGQLTMQWTVKIPTLSNPTDSFVTHFGLGDVLNTGFPLANGIYFEGVDNVNSGNWQIISSASSVVTTNNTSTALDTSWHTYKIVVNAAATSVSFYIDGTQVANSPISTNIPTSAALIPFCKLRTQSGSNTKRIYVDLFTLNYSLTTPR